MQSYRCGKVNSGVWAQFTPPRKHSLTRDYYLSQYCEEIPTWMTPTPRLGMECRILQSRACQPLSRSRGRRVTCRDRRYRAPRSKSPLTTVFAKQLEVICHLHVLKQTLVSISQYFASSHQNGEKRRITRTYAVVIPNFYSAPLTLSLCPWSLLDQKVFRTRSQVHQALRRLRKAMRTWRASPECRKLCEF